MADGRFRRLMVCDGVVVVTSLAVVLVWGRRVRIRRRIQSDNDLRSFVASPTFQVRSLGGGPALNGQARFRSYFFLVTLRELVRALLGPLLTVHQGCRHLVLPPVSCPSPPHPHHPSRSQALWAYLLRLTEAVTSVARSAVPTPPAAPSAVAGMGALLVALGDLIAEVPPGPTTVGRYGNAAFREWHGRACRALPDLVRGIGVTDDADVAEVVDLFSLCWGNATRLDYGNGHEAAFLVVLFVLSEKVRRGGGMESRQFATSS